MQYVDTHFHTLHFLPKETPAYDIFNELKLSGFAGGIDAGTHPDDIPLRRDVLEGVPGIRLSGGIHPGCLRNHSLEALEESMDELYRWARNGTICAVGECGIDRYRNHGTLEDQMQLFRMQLEAARALDLPVIIHNREADREIFKALEEIRPEAGGIMHCFSSDAETAERSAALGMHVSFAGNLTYRRNSGLRQAAQAVPLEFLLAETDSPYLSPEPMRGRPNHPGNVVYVYQALAQIRDMAVEVLMESVCASLDRLLTRDERTR